MPSNTFGNEFFVLVDPLNSAAFEEIVISPLTIMTADTPEGPFTVSGATNANPIVLTIGAHSLLVGRGVVIDGVGGNLAANGVFMISAVTGTTISIPVAGSGTYTAGGSVNVANQAQGFSPSLGEIIHERDVLASNNAVVQNGNGGGKRKARYMY